MMEFIVLGTVSNLMIVSIIGMLIEWHGLKVHAINYLAFIVLTRKGLFSYIILL
jgi:hypothetical protein